MSIFISYRRSDSDSAVLFYSWLRERFGARQVFWDREDIPAGARWGDVLTERLGRSRALVALIGPDWLTMTDPDGRRRLEDPGDWVRREIAAALQSGVLVVQVLMNGAKAPARELLPPDLRDLAELQVLRLSDLRVRDQLLDVLDRVVPARRPVGAVEDDQRGRRMQQLLARQVARLQVRAVELIQDGRLDRATDELREGSELLLALLEMSPGDVRLDAQLGYLYATTAQSLDAAGDPAGADRYVELAGTAFHRVLASPAEGGASEVASALNGLAGIHSRRGQLDEAIALYLDVVAAAPGYAYAWHDLFAALDLRARSGRIDVELMVRAVERVRATGLGQPGLGRDHVEMLERMTLNWARVALEHPERVVTVEASPERSESAGRQSD